MRRLSVALLALSFAFPLSAQPQVGDTARARIHIFRLILSSFDTNVVYRAVGNVCDVVTPYERMFIRDIKPVSGNEIIVGTNGKKIYVSTDNGLTWSLGVPAGDTLVPAEIYEVETDVGPPPIKYVAGPTGLFRKVGGGSGTYQSITPTAGGAPVAVYSVSRNPETHGITRAVLYAATDYGVYRSTNGGNTWDSLGLSQVVRVKVDPTDTSYVYASTASGFYYYRNGTWTEGGSEAANANNLFVGSDGTLYAATDNGLYYSTDHGMSWSSFADLAGKTVTDIYAAAPNDVYATVPGEGVWHYDGSSWNLVMNGLEPYTALGAYNVYAVEGLNDGSVAIGTDWGVFKLEGGIWKNYSTNLGFNVGDVPVDIAFQAFEVDGVAGNVQNALGISPDEIQDADGDGKIHVVIADLVESANTQVYPIFGYFFPNNQSDSTIVRDALYIDAIRFLSDFDTDLQHGFLAFLYGKFAAWALDHDESNFTLTGMGMLGALLAGYPVSEGFESGFDFASDPNWSLSAGTPDYVVASPVVRETDRERYLCFFDYLYEAYGADVIGEILRNAENGLASIDSVLQGHGSSFLDAFKGWTVANYLESVDSTTYQNLDFQIAINGIPEGITTTVEYPLAATYWSIESGNVSFNASDALYPESPYVVKAQDTMWSEVTLDEKNRFQEKGLTTPTVYIVANTASGDEDFLTIGFSQDTVPPSVVDLVTLQNPVRPSVLDFYVIGKEPLYSDVDVNTPSVLVTTGDSTYSISTYDFAAGDTTRIYFAHVTLSDTGLLILQGMGQDQSGNETLSVPDTVTVFRFGSQGGTFVADHGRVILDVQPGAVGSEVWVLYNRLPAEALTRLYGVPAESGSPVYVLGSSAVVFARAAQLTITDPDLVGADENYALYRFDGRSWVLLPSTFDPRTGTVRAQIDRLGIFQIRGVMGGMIFAFSGPYPNPVTGISGGPVTLAFTLPVRAEVSLRVYDVTGRLVRVLAKGTFAAGHHVVSWDLRDSGGRALSSGVYFYRFEAGPYRVTRKMTLVR